MTTVKQATAPHQRFNLRVLRLACAAAIALLAILPAAAGAEPWKVHEWGTFTVLQDEQGRELPGINVDDEPVPDFVHNLAELLMNPSIVSNLHWQYRQKGAPRSHPRVTMRLETPVIYFHPPRDAKLPATIDVGVQFRGGWLTEFYPHADATAPGLRSNAFDFGELKPDAVSSLTWSKLLVGTGTDGPQTDWKVWLAPREVKCAWVTNARKESERYLFYRGVANAKAPLRVTTDRKAGELKIYGNFSHSLSAGAKVSIPKMWLVHVSGKTTAFRALDGVKGTTDDAALLATTKEQFPAGEFASGNLAKLKEQMHQALVDEGLFADEATAMLNTWERAYFTSPGKRLFYIVPDAWTDTILPLKLSVDAKVERAMIGRIELITQKQRELLAKIAAGPASDPKWIDSINPRNPNLRPFLAGRADFGDLGVKVPADYQLYLDLGRFRNALIVAAEREQTKTGLTTFVNNYGLRHYSWAKPEEPARTGAR